MTGYDATMIGVVVLGMLWGTWKGAVWQVATLCSLGLGFAVAHPGSVKIAPFLAGDPLAQRMGAMLIVYVATSGGVFTVAWMLRSFLRKIRLQAYDRHLGMLLGGATGAALGMIATLFITSLSPQSRPAVFQSQSGKLAARGLWTIEKRLPPEASDMLAPFIDQMEREAIEKAAGSGKSGSPSKLAAAGRRRTTEPSQDEVNSRNTRKRQDAGEWLDRLGRTLSGSDSDPASDSGGDDYANSRRR